MMSVYSEQEWTLALYSLYYVSDFNTTHLFCLLHPVL